MPLWFSNARPGGTIDGVLDVSREEFERLVSEALDGIPPELTDLMKNVAVFVEDEPPSDDPDLLGIYEGVPLTERGVEEPYVPDRITIYRAPIEAMTSSPKRQARIVRDTVVHEIAHHFGISDARLEELGLGDEE